MKLLELLSENWVTSILDISLSWGRNNMRYKRKWTRKKKQWEQNGSNVGDEQDLSFHQTSEISPNKWNTFFMCLWSRSAWVLFVQLIFLSQKWVALWSFKPKLHRQNATGYSSQQLNAIMKQDLKIKPNLWPDKYLFTSVCFLFKAKSTHNIYLRACLYQNQTASLGYLTNIRNKSVPTNANGSLHTGLPTLVLASKTEATLCRRRRYPVT